MSSGFAHEFYFHLPKFAFRWHLVPTTNDHKQGSWLHYPLANIEHPFLQDENCYQ